MIGHRPVKSGGHKLCGIGDIKFSICRMTLHDHVVRGLCDIMNEFLSSYVTTLSIFMAIGFVEKEIFCFSLIM